MATVTTLLDKLKQVAGDHRFGIKESIDLLKSYIKLTKSDDNTLINILADLTRLRKSINTYVVTYEEANRSENKILMRYLDILDMMNYNELSVDYTKLDVIIDDDEYDINSLPVNVKKVERPKAYAFDTDEYIDNTTQYEYEKTITKLNTNNNMAPMSLISFQYYLSVFVDTDPNSELGLELINHLKDYLDYQAKSINNPIFDASKTKLNNILQKMNEVRDKITSSQTQWVDELNDFIQQNKFNEAYAIFVQNSNTTNKDLEDLLKKYYEDKAEYLSNVIKKKLQEIVAEIIS